VHIFAQILGEMVVEPVETPGNWINLNPDKALLIVYSDIGNLTFTTNNRGVLDVTQVQKGVFRVLLYPGTHLITYSTTDGLFKDIDDRIYIEAGKIGERRVKVNRDPGISVGRGNLRIESDPLGAKIRFNDIQLNDMTPYTLSNQPSGRHNLHLDLEGYVSLDTSIMIEKDMTKTYKFNLIKELASLNVLSDPSGAKVYLDGDSIGITPLERNDLTPGEKSLLVQKEGYINNFQTIRLRPNETKTFNIDLIRQSGTLEISTNPEGANIYLDGNEVGVYKGFPLVIDNVPIGKHQIRAVMIGYDENTTSADVNFDQISTVHLVLKGKLGALFVSSTPDGANIFIDSKNTGKKSPYKFNDLPNGKYQLTLTMPGYLDTLQTLNVAPGATKSVNITLKSAPRQISSASIKVQPDSLIKVDYKSIIKPVEDEKTSSQYRTPQIIAPSIEAKSVSDYKPTIDIKRVEFLTKFEAIPQGSFNMGAELNYQIFDLDETPSHRVEIRQFYMMTTEVTQVLWTEIMGYNPSSVVGDYFPVDNISWEDIQLFISRLNQIVSGRNYRLPTEAEWEYACRAGTTTKYYNGNNDDNLKDICWFRDNSDSQIHPVKQKQANAYGLFDMLGNVWEWCSDSYHNNYNKAPSDGSSWVDPNSNFKVLRGGSFQNDKPYNRTTSRIWGNQKNSSAGMGFRLAY
jgi:formylglycine-generating enzyme required for sulfatase activity